MKKLLVLSLAAFAAAGASAQTVIQQADFAAGQPAGWTRTQNTPSAGWEFGSNIGSQYFPIPAHGAYAASNDDAHDDNSTTANDASADRLITPVMDLTPYAASGVVLKFAYVQPANWGSTGHVEVSTNGGSTWTNVLDVTAQSDWTNVTVNLSSYTNSATVQVAFRHNDGGNWADGFAIDDVVIQSVPALDAAVDAINNSSYVAAGSTSIDFTLSNQGYQTITSATLSYTVDGGTPVQQNFTGLSIALGANLATSFSTPANIAIGAHNICVNVVSVNGGTDAVASNDQACAAVSALSSIPTKRAILEDHTGAWCQFCPDGAVVADQVDANYPEAIVVAIHNNDQMDIAEGNVISGEYISGYPGGLIDHYKFATQSAVEVNRGDWDALVGERLGMIVPVSVSLENVTWNAATRQITATVRASFVGAMSGDLRLNMFVVEDHVTGTGTGYDQVNYYNTVSGHPYYGAGNPIQGFDHRHVVREIVGTAWGTTGAIPASVNDGDSHTYTYSYTLPAGYDETEVYLIGMMQEYSSNNEQRQIYNSVETKLSTATAVDPTKASISSVYPNPFTTSTNVEFNLEAGDEVTVEVLDVLGQRVAVLANGFMGQGMHTVVWDGMNNGAPAAAGVYSVVVKTSGKSLVEKVVLTR